MSKRIILTTKQFTKICEGVDDANNQVLYAPNDGNVSQVINNGIKQMRQNGNTNGTLTITKNIDTINGNNDQSETISLNVGKGTPDEITKVKQQAQTNGISGDKLNYQINVVNGKPVENTFLNNESKRYTKQSIEEARLKNLKENCTRFTKKELNEGFLGDFSAQQVQNMTDIYDDDEMNAAIGAEERENILSNICRDICATDRGARKIFDGVFNFKTIIDIMKNHGFTYMGPYEEDETYNFTDGENEIVIWPYSFYERPGAIHITNINIYEVGMNENVSNNKNKINEASNSNLKRKYINYIYNGLKNLTNKMYKDDNWEGVSNIYKTLQHMLEGKGEVEMYVEHGGYWKQLGEFPNYKEYKIKVNTNDGIEINGSLKCHAAGTIEDTFKYYDITITLW